MHHLMRAIAATADSDDDDNDVWSYTTGPLFKHSNVRKVNKVLEHFLVVWRRFSLSCLFCDILFDIEGDKKLL